MLADLKTDDEEGRLRALTQYDVVGTPEEAPFDKIVALVQQVMQVPVALVSLIDRDRQWFKAKRGTDLCESPRDISFCTHAIKTPDPFVVRDATKDPLFASNPLVTGEPFIRAYAGVPLRTPDGYNIGTLCAIDTKPRDFPPEQIAILSSFAKLVVDELELRRIASSDQLTDALSRRAFIEAARREFDRARRYGRPLSVVMLDIDRFKVVNDAHGHAAGDRVIRAVAETGMAQNRQSDAFGRLGGEEFALLLPETGMDGAFAAAERVRLQVEARPIALRDGEDAPHANVTVSAGAATLEPGDADIEALLDRADHALYAAKKSGRNRTVAAKIRLAAVS